MTQHRATTQVGHQKKGTAGVSDSYEAARELVQQTLSREWCEPTVAVHIAFDPAFQVPGRRDDGSFVSQHRVRRFIGRVGRAVASVVVVAVELISDSSTGLHPWISLYSGEVRGAEGSSAVQFADAVRGKFWLVISASRLAAAKAGSSSPLIVMWSAVGSDCPQLDRDASTLRWPDGSSVSFLLHSAERQRLATV